MPREPIIVERDYRSMRTLALCLALAGSEPPEYDPNVPYEQQRPNYRVLERDPQPLPGTLALGFGITGLVIGGHLVPVGAAWVKFYDPNFFGWMMFGTGTVLAGLGTAGIIVGAKRRKAWKDWAARNRGRARRLQLTPSGWANRESIGFAIAGRF
jgi:hypothetical protein